MSPIPKEGRNFVSETKYVTYRTVHLPLSKCKFEK